MSREGHCAKKNRFTVKNDEERERERSVAAVADTNSTPIKYMYLYRNDKRSKHAWSWTAKFQSIAGESALVGNGLCMGADSRTDRKLYERVRHERRCTAPQRLNDAFECREWTRGCRGGGYTSQRSWIYLVGQETPAFHYNRSRVQEREGESVGSVCEYHGETSGVSGGTSVQRARPGCWLHCTTAAPRLSFCWVGTARPEG